MYVPPESPSAENRPQCGGRQAETAAPSGATEEKRRHNNGMWWSLAHHSRTGENRENRTTFTTKKSEISSLFSLIYRADLAIVMIK
ncbi:hypothetical protein MWH83_004092 [Salmonella enterica]|nr:hypothetical protein [Salmonella enterica]